MSVLITGGTGFIGADIVRQLLNDGVKDIYVMHRSGNFDRLAGLTEQVNFIQADLSEPEQLRKAIEIAKPEVVYHLGALLSVFCEQNPQAAVEANAFGTYHLLEAARQAGVRQFLFASSIASYGADMQDEVMDDYTLQRPLLIYGVTKVFGEQLGFYYKRKYGLDFRGLRYPSIVGPGVKTPGIVQYTSWVIEQCAQGNPYTIEAEPYTVVPIMYYKEAAAAMIQLGRAPLEQIKMVNYLIDGPKPTPTAAELVDIVKRRLPKAQITFKPRPDFQPMLDQLRPLDDSKAREEWGWQPSFDYATMVDDFLAELN